MVNLSLFFVFLRNTYKKYLHWSKRRWYKYHWS